MKQEVVVILWKDMEIEVILWEDMGVWRRKRINILEGQDDDKKETRIRNMRRRNIMRKK